MACHRISTFFRTTVNLRKISGIAGPHIRSTITTRSGAYLPEPKQSRYRFLGVVCSITVGLVLGTTLSKAMANFLEEKELFVPSDDDDDDDDD